MDIYLFDNYRKVLEVAFREKKKQDSRFSYRKFAELAGIKNPGCLHDVIKGKRPLSERLTEKAIEIFEIKNAHADYFRLLVAYGNERDPVLRRALYREMERKRAYSRFFKLHGGQVRYYQDTVYPLLIAALEAHPIREEYEDLGRFLDPTLPAGRVEKCIGELCSWGLVRRDDDGILRVVHKFLKPPKTLRELVRGMNKMWLEQATEALDRIDPDDRHISTILLSVSDDARKRILDKLERFRSEIFEIAENDTDADSVMQLSLAYFPKSKSDI